MSHAIETVEGEEVLVSKEDYEKFSNHIWHINDRGYAFRYKYFTSKKGRTRKRKSLMHHEVRPLKKKGNVIDHINQNKLDNRRQNLREITVAQNARNRSKHAGAKTAYKGVRKYRNQYRTTITFNYKDIEVGVFDDEVFAAVAYDVWAKRLDAEHFSLNFPEGHELEQDVIQFLDHPKQVKAKAEEGDYRGIKYDKGKKSYIAVIGYAGEKHKLGSRKDPAEAALLYDTAARILHGKKAVVNFPNTEPDERIVEKANAILEKYGIDEKYQEPVIISDKDRPKPPPYIGVSNGRPGKYTARIYHEGKSLFIGQFDSPEEAALAYNQAALEYRGESAKLNRV